MHLPYCGSLHQLSQGTVFPMVSWGTVHFFNQGSGVPKVPQRKSLWKKRRGGLPPCSHSESFPQNQYRFIFFFGGGESPGHHSCLELGKGVIECPLLSVSPAQSICIQWCTPLMLEFLGVKTRRISMGNFQQGSWTKLDERGFS